MRFWQYAITSFALTFAVTIKSLAVYPNFYSAATALGSHPGLLLVTANQFLVLLWFLGKIIVQLFFGQLRLAEIDQIYQKIWILAIDCMLIASNLDIIAPAYDFAVMISIVGFLLIIHWVLQERCSVLFQMINLPTPLDFIRVFVLAAVLVFIDIKLFAFGCAEFLQGSRVFLLLTSRFADLVQLSVGSLTKLLVDFYEVYVVQKEDEDDEWEAKSTILFVVDVTLESLTLAVYAVICYILGTLSFHMMFSVVDKLRRVYTLLLDYYRSITTKRQLVSYVSDPTAQDISRDNLCVICREEMVLGNTGRMVPKKMQCGHVIHLACLNVWLNRSQNCPTCRQPVKQAKSAFISDRSVSDVGSPGTASTDIAATTSSSAGSGTSRASPQSDPGPDTSAWLSFPTRTNSGVQQIQIGEFWYEFSAL